MSICLFKEGHDHAKGCHSKAHWENEPLGMNVLELMTKADPFRKFDNGQECVGNGSNPKNNTTRFLWPFFGPISDFVMQKERQKHDGNRNCTKTRTALGANPFRPAFLGILDQTTCKEYGKECKQDCRNDSQHLIPSFGDENKVWVDSGSSKRVHVFRAKLERGCQTRQTERNGKVTRHHVTNPIKVVFCEFIRLRFVLESNLGGWIGIDTFRRGNVLVGMHVVPRVHQFLTGRSVDSIHRVGQQTPLDANHETMTRRAVSETGFQRRKDEQHAQYDHCRNVVTGKETCGRSSGEDGTDRRSKLFPRPGH
mmetsp:Transcript_26941/g.74292  ORF Transcript_26941/g.74292 Transcript_26941/m.74292 type:complete len:310 (+) Transcript_26941:1346-2275(+)